MGVECSDEDAIQLGAKRGAKRGGKSGGKNGAKSGAQSGDHDSFHLNDLRDWIRWICAK